MEWSERYQARQINYGSYGIIYEIIGDTSLVIKALNPANTDPEDKRRIQREIHCLRQLQGNPNIIQISDYDSKANLPWFVMPRATTNLHEYVLQQKALTDEETLYITQMILNALEQAHGKNILHRDLGPSNILLFKDFEEFKVRVADFSLGRDFNKETKPLTKHSHAGLGQDSFVAHEQYESLENSTNLSDIYSIGALMLYMNTGRNPLRTSPQGSFATVIQELMQNDPIKRPQSIAEVRDLLERFSRIRNPQRIKLPFLEIASIYSERKSLSDENILDLTNYLTRENQLYTGNNQGDMTYTHYFSPLFESPSDFIPTWVEVYATDTQVNMFMDRFQEQMELIMRQTKWSFSSMSNICYFLMQLYRFDKLKIRVADMVINAYLHSYGEAYLSLVTIVSTEYKNTRMVEGLAMVLGKYLNNKLMKEFLSNHGEQVKHISFMEVFGLV